MISNVETFCGFPKFKKPNGSSGSLAGAINALTEKFGASSFLLFTFHFSTRFLCLGSSRINRKA